MRSIPLVGRSGAELDQTSPGNISTMAAQMRHPGSSHHLPQPDRVDSDAQSIWYVAGSDWSAPQSLSNVSAVMQTPGCMSQNACAVLDSTDPSRDPGLWQDPTGNGRSAAGVVETYGSSGRKAAVVEQRAGPDGPVLSRPVRCSTGRANPRSAGQRER
jgi:hypothetical protein